MVVVGGGAVSYERGTPVRFSPAGPDCFHPAPATRSELNRSNPDRSCSGESKVWDLTVRLSTTYEIRKDVLGPSGRVKIVC